VGTQTRFIVISSSPLSVIYLFELYPFGTVKKNPNYHDVTFVHTAIDCRVGLDFSNRCRRLCDNRHITSNSDLDLEHRHLGSNPRMCLDVIYPYSKFSVNRPYQSKVIERKLNFYFSNSDLNLDHRHLGSKPKLPLCISYLYSKVGVNRPKQTKVIERKQKVDARTPARSPAADFGISITRFLLKTWLHIHVKFSFRLVYLLLC